MAPHQTLNDRQQWTREDGKATGILAILAILVAILFNHGSSAPAPLPAEIAEQLACYEARSSSATSDQKASAPANCR